MITLPNINGSPEQWHDKGFGHHSDTNSFYFFESEADREAFFANRVVEWSKEAHIAEVESAVDSLVSSTLNDLWYASLGDLAATALNTKARWNAEAIAVNEWQAKCYELLEDYKLLVTEESAQPIETFINSLPKFAN